MKTPREILLARHREAEPKLDQLRRNVVASMARSESADGTPNVTFAGRLWQELFWSCRRVWFGLGVAWMAILMLHIAARDPEVVATGKPQPANQMAQELHRRQQQLMAELGIPVETQPAEPPKLPPVLKPRSEWRGTNGMA